MRGRQKALVACMVAALGAAFLASAWTRIEPGNVGIKVAYTGEGRDGEEYTVVSGLVWSTPVVTALYEYPTSTQTVSWDADQAVAFNSRDGVVFRAALSLSFSLLKDKVPAFYLKFRSDDLPAYAGGFLRNVAIAALNESAAGFTAEELYSGKKEAVVKLATARIQEKVSQTGVVIEQFGFLGVPTPPEAIKAAMESKIVAVQEVIRAEQTVRLKKAEGDTQVSTVEASSRARVAVARAQAEANRVLNDSLTPRLLEWEKIKAPRNCGLSELKERLEQNKKIRIGFSPAL